MLKVVVDGLLKRSTARRGGGKLLGLDVVSFPSHRVLYTTRGWRLFLTYDIIILVASTSDLSELGRSDSVQRKPSKSPNVSSRSLLLQSHDQTESRKKC